SIFQHAEELPRFGLQFLFLFWNEGNHVAENVERGYTWIPSATHGLHRCDKDCIHTESAMKRSQRHDESNGRTVGICSDESAIALARWLLLNELQVIPVYLGDHERDIFLHAKCTRIRDNSMSGLSKFRLEFLRNAGIESGKNDCGSTIRHSVAHTHLRDALRDRRIQLPTRGLGVRKSR